MKKWKATLGQVDHPLAPYRGKPVYSGAGKDSRYLGRVILELWEVQGPNGPAVTTSLGTDPVDGDGRGLSEKALKAFAKLLEEIRGT